MGGNFFHSSIPKASGNLNGLQALDLSQNNQSGYIPSFLEGFQFLKYMNLSSNNFEGEVPTNGIFTNVSAVSCLKTPSFVGGS